MIEIIKNIIGILIILLSISGLFYVIHLGVQSEIESGYYNQTNQMNNNFSLLWGINPANPASPVRTAMRS